MFYPIKHINWIASKPRATQFRCYHGRIHLTGHAEIGQGKNRSICARTSGWMCSNDPVRWSRTLGPVKYDVIFQDTGVNKVDPVRGIENRTDDFARRLESTLRNFYYRCDIKHQAKTNKSKTSIHIFALPTSFPSRVRSKRIILGVL